MATRSSVVGLTTAIAVVAAFGCGGGDSAGNSAVNDAGRSDGGLGGKPSVGGATATNAGTTTKAGNAPLLDGGLGGTAANGGATSNTGTSVSSGGVSSVSTSAIGGSATVGGTVTTITSSGAASTSAGTGNNSGGTASNAGGAASATGGAAGTLGGAISTNIGGSGVGGTTSCATGSAKDPTGSCVACTLTCNQTGQTGAIYPLTTSAGICMCTSLPGYYYSAQGAIGTYPCDADGDGWVRDSARAAIESTDTAVRGNARCTLRLVNEIILTNEDLEDYSLYPSNTGTNLTTDATLRDGALPLYESVRNDEQRLLDGNSKVPQYGASGRSLRAGEVNSLTKACVTSIADHNDNGVNDVAEWGEPPSSQVSVAPQSAGRDPYLNVYARLSYFVELHTAWFEATDTVTTGPTVTGRYHIAERSRSLNFGITNNPALGDSAWQTCTRRRDSFYADGSDAITYDFASLSGSAQASTWEGMLHHTQFKCVQTISQADYSALSAQQQRTQLYKQSAANLGTLGWELNSCTVIGALDPSSSDTTNPRSPLVTCTYQSTPPSLDQVLWAASNYQNYTVPGGYTRGCVNECVEDHNIFVTDATQCKVCTPTAYGKATIAPASNTTACLLNRLCDGAGTCSKCAPNYADCNQNIIADGCEINLQTAADHCGTCGTDCNSPAAAHTASADCVAAQCRVVTCSAGAYDVNGSFNDGCECIQDSNGASCATATTVPTSPLPIGGSPVTLRGNITPADRDDWFYVSFATGATCSYHPKIVLDPGAEPVRMQVMSDCNASPFTCGAGEAPGSTADSTTWEFTNSTTCGDQASIDPTPDQGAFIQMVQSSTVYIRVHSIGSSTTCKPYTLTISN